jgi:hypothetical protein
MYKTLFILAIGVVVGYSYGWTDAQENVKHVADRLIDRIVGETRSQMGNDVDARFQTSNLK